MGWFGGRSDSVETVEGAQEVVSRVMTRTVNGTGHTGPSEFCATSI